MPNLNKRKADEIYFRLTLKDMVLLRNHVPRLELICFNEPFPTSFFISQAIIRIKTVDFFKNGPIPASLCFFMLFYMTQIKYKLIKVLMVCLGLEPGAAGWRAWTNPVAMAPKTVDLPSGIQTLTVRVEHEHADGTQLTNTTDLTYLGTSSLSVRSNRTCTSRSRGPFL